MKWDVDMEEMTADDNAQNEEAPMGNFEDEVLG